MMGGEMACCEVDKRLISLKICYFLVFAGIASLTPYMSVILTQLGLNSTELGAIFGSIFFVTCIKNALIGYVADRFQIHKALLIVSCILTGPLYCSIAAIPSVKPIEASFTEVKGVHCIINETAVNSNYSILRCDDSMNCKPFQFELDGFDCSDVTPIVNDGEQVVSSGYRKSIIIGNESQAENTSTFTLPHESVVACQATVNCTKLPEPYTSMTFWLCLTVTLAAALAGSNEPMLNDAIAITLLGEDRSKWGRSRLFGSLGYGLCALLLSILIEGIGTGKEKDRDKIDYTPAFFLYLSLSLAAAVVACFHKKSKLVKSSQEMKDVKKILSNARVMFFLFLVFLSGVFNGIQFTYGILYIRMGLKASQLILGICVLVSVVAEIPSLLFGGKIVEKVGTWPCLYISLLAYAVRMFGYVYIPSAWWAPLIEVTHMFTFGLMFSAAMMHASRISTKRTIGTMIGLVNGLQWGLGLGVGSIGGGHMLKAYGFKTLFKCTGVAALVVMAVYIVVNEFILRFLCSNRSAEYPVNSVKVEQVPSDDTEVALNGDTKTSQSDTSHADATTDSLLL